MSEGQITRGATVGSPERLRPAAEKLSARDAGRALLDLLDAGSYSMKDYEAALAALAEACGYVAPSGRAA